MNKLTVGAVMQAAAGFVIGGLATAAPAPAAPPNIPPGDYLVYEYQAGAFERIDGTVVPSWRGEHWKEDGLVCTGSDKANTGPFNQTWIITDDLTGTVLMHWTPETSSCFGETEGRRADLRLVPA